jgi:hypothetical protein
LRSSFRNGTSNRKRHVLGNGGASRQRLDEARNGGISGTSTTRGGWRPWTALLPEQQRACVRPQSPWRGRFAMVSRGFRTREEPPGHREPTDRVRRLCRKWRWWSRATGTSRWSSQLLLLRGRLKVFSISVEVAAVGFRHTTRGEESKYSAQRHPKSACQGSPDLRGVIPGGGASLSNLQGRSPRSSKLPW